MEYLKVTADSRCLELRILSTAVYESITRLSDWLQKHDYRACDGPLLGIPKSRSTRECVLGPRVHAFVRDNRRCGVG